MIARNERRRQWRRRPWASVCVAEELAVILTPGPFDQIGDVPHKNTSIGLASRVGRLEADAATMHAELPRVLAGGGGGGAAAKPLHHAQALIELLCPPLTLQEILELVRSGPHCSGVSDGSGGAFMLRVSAPGLGSAFDIRLAAPSQRPPLSVVTVSVGGVPRLAFGITQALLLSEVPLRVAAPSSAESLLAMNHSNDAHIDNPVPHTVSNLLVHVLGTHVHDIVERLEMEIDNIELHLDKECNAPIWHFSLAAG